MDFKSTISQIAQIKKEILALSELYQLTSQKKENVALRSKILGEMQALQKKLKQLKEA